MSWRKQLIEFEKNKQWDTAIEFMQSIIEKEPNNIDAYLCICYLLMNLLVEEDYDCDKHDYYAKLLKKYYETSFEKFSHNPEYLFFIGRILCMAEWYVNVDIHDVELMLHTAMNLDPNNIIYQFTYYSALHLKDPSNQSVLLYAKKILDQHSYLKNELLKKGSLGEYILDIMMHWSKKVVNQHTKM